MSGGVPAGWVLVPVEPTLDMQDSATTVDVDTGQGSITALNWEEAAEVWAKMLAATPTPPIEGRDADVERVAQAIGYKLLELEGDTLAHGLTLDEWRSLAIAAIQALGERG